MHLRCSGCEVAVGAGWQRIVKAPSSQTCGGGKTLTDFEPKFLQQNCRSRRVVIEVKFRKKLGLFPKWQG